MHLTKLTSIGMKRIGRYIFKYKDKKICPDFVLEYVSNNNELIKLSKPLYIEYFGLFNTNNSSLALQYKNKIDFKMEFYDNNKNIDIIYLYPEDLKNEFAGVKLKIDNFISKTSKNTELKTSI